MGPGWYETDWAALAGNDMAMPPYGKAGLFDKEVIFASIQSRCWDNPLDPAVSRNGTAKALIGTGTSAQ